MKQSGYTLIEIIIVIVIVGIIATTVLGAKKDPLKARCHDNTVVVNVSSATYTLRDANGNIVQCNVNTRTQSREVEQQNL